MMRERESGATMNNAHFDGGLSRRHQSKESEQATLNRVSQVIEQFRGYGQQVNQKVNELRQDPAQLFAYIFAANRPLENVLGFIQEISDQLPPAAAGSMHDQLRTRIQVKIALINKTLISYEKAQNAIDRATTSSPLKEKKTNRYGIRRLFGVALAFLGLAAYTGVSRAEEKSPPLDPSGFVVNTSSETSSLPDFSNLTQLELPLTQLSQLVEQVNIMIGVAQQILETELAAVLNLANNSTADEDLSAVGQDATRGVIYPQSIPSTEASQPDRSGTDYENPDRVFDAANDNGLSTAIDRVINLSPAGTPEAPENDASIKIITTLTPTPAPTEAPGETPGEIPQTKPEFSVMSPELVTQLLAFAETEITAVTDTVTIPIRDEVTMSKIQELLRSNGQSAVADNLALFASILEHSNASADLAGVQLFLMPTGADVTADGGIRFFGKIRTSTGFVIDPDGLYAWEGKELSPALPGAVVEPVVYSTIQSLFGNEITTILNAASVSISPTDTVLISYTTEADGTKNILSMKVAGIPKPITFSNQIPAGESHISQNISYRPGATNPETVLTSEQQSVRDSLETRMSLVNPQLQAEINNPINGWNLDYELKAYTRNYEGDVQIFRPELIPTQEQVASGDYPYPEITMDMGITREMGTFVSSDNFTFVFEQGGNNPADNLILNPLMNDPALNGPITSVFTSKIDGLNYLRPGTTLRIIRSGLPITADDKVPLGLSVNTVGYTAHTAKRSPDWKAGQIVIATSTKFGGPDLATSSAAVIAIYYLVDTEGKYINSPVSQGTVNAVLNNLGDLIKYWPFMAPPAQS